jgi:hypothetical protein
VAVVSLWPRLVFTERVRMSYEGQAMGFSLGSGFDPARDSDTPELQGRAIAHLASDPQIMQVSGKVQIVADLASRYGFTDLDGRMPQHSPRILKCRAQRGAIAPTAYG